MFPYCCCSCCSSRTYLPTYQSVYSIQHSSWNQCCKEMVFHYYCQTQSSWYHLDAWHIDTLINWHWCWLTNCDHFVDFKNHQNSKEKEEYWVFRPVPGPWRTRSPTKLKAGAVKASPGNYSKNCKSHLMLLLNLTYLIPTWNFNTKALLYWSQGSNLKCWFWEAILIEKLFSQKRNFVN